jgi:hypothetical protein
MALIREFRGNRYPYSRFRRRHLADEQRLDWQNPGASSGAWDSATPWHHRVGG